MTYINSTGNFRKKGMPRYVNATVLALLVMALSFGIGPLGFAPTSAHAAVDVTIVNSDVDGNQVSRFDVDGNSLDAHDGSVLQVGGLFYLYGTSYACGYKYEINSDFCGFKVYSSPDLVNWADQGFVVAPHACGYCFRPHVIYNALTKKYVLWSDGGGGVYNVYTNSSPTGLFKQEPSPKLPVGGAVDLSLFEDDNGDAYLIHNTTQVGPKLTADGVVEELSRDYLTTTGHYVKFGLGDVEAFTVFKRDGVYHALMADPTCAYCSTATGELTATSMLGDWSGAWYDLHGVNQNGAPEPRFRARLVNATSCGGEPLATFPVHLSDGSTQYYFMSDRWDDRRANEGTANFFVGPMAFDGKGMLQQIDCVNSFTVDLAGTGGAANVSPTQDQSSGSDGFRHYCDIAGNVERQQTFTPSRSGTLNAVSITAFGWKTSEPLVIKVVDMATGVVLSSDTESQVPWAPHVMTVNPQIQVIVGHRYALRLQSATIAPTCYGFEYNDKHLYSGGNESYSTNAGASFTDEVARDLKFTTAVGNTALLGSNQLPAGYTYCATEGGTCTISGAAVVAYGAGSYVFRTVSGSVTCGVAAFGSDPALGVLKSCYIPPTGAPSGYTPCARENGLCSFTGQQMVAFGANGAFTYELATNSKSCDSVTFGGDPLYGTPKSCSLAPAGTPPGGWTLCAAENDECSVYGMQTVAFGAYGSFLTQKVGTSTSCTRAAFGGDPDYGVVKACYVHSGPPTGYGPVCAGESGTCSFSGFQTVAYGAAGEFIYRSFTNGTKCNPSAFGGDPIFGVVKSCYLTP